MASTLTRRWARSPIRAASPPSKAWCRTPWAKEQNWRPAAIALGTRILLRADRGQRRAERCARDERGAVRTAGADLPLLDLRRGGRGSQPVAIRPRVLRLHQLDQNRDRDRRRLRSRHGLDQQFWSGFA